LIWEEIHEQPQAIEDTMAQEEDNIAQVAQRLRDEDIR